MVEWKTEMNINGPSVCYLGHKALSFHHALRLTKENMVKMHEFLEIWYFTIKLHCNCSSWRALEESQRPLYVWRGTRTRRRDFLQTLCDSS